MRIFFNSSLSLFIIFVLSLSNLLSQHDRERNAFRYLAEGKLDKAYFELKMERNILTLLEKLSFQHYVYWKKKVKEAFEMAQLAVELGLLLSDF